ncbi:MAG: OmpA family protein [Gammaproteobacteria bacterium]|nr:OmpA family protein [Gammaproteobacteria bacterium]MDH3362899.1 OmpA family protein [Gammaproteobacteria bacterium]MDH3481043.1 OmpA family protein [Gammaproteobacteria bacterium]
MRYTFTALTTVAVASLLFAPLAFAATKSSKEESIGVGSGAVIGAAAGGPVGFIVGAAIGAKLGDAIHRKNDRLEELEVSLGDSRATVAVLETDIDKLGGEIGRLRDVARPELVSLLQAGIALDLLFRTDEFALSDATGDRLSRLAGTLAAMPDIRIQLDGFADERGDEEYNRELSEKRAEFVREQFVVAGVHPDRINVTAHGESMAQDDTADSLALERRVSVKLFISDAPSLAANPN